MSDSELVSLVTDFRDGLLDGRPSSRMCFALCAPLESYLGLLGFKALLVEGSIDDSNHYWLQLDDGRILDPSADQFATATRPMPPVYVGLRPEFYRDAD